MSESDDEQQLIFQSNMKDAKEFGRQDQVLLRTFLHAFVHMSVKGWILKKGLISSRYQSSQLICT